MAIPVRLSSRSKAARATKYGNKRTNVDGVVFDSKAEADRYFKLRLLEKAGQIANIRRQVPYRLEVNGVLVATYKADFVYQDLREKVEIVEDVKSAPTKTRDYAMKRKLMQACHGITIREVM